MTATAFITVNSVSNVTLVPNSALRFTPPQDKTLNDSQSGNKLVANLIGRRPPGAGQKPAQQKQNDNAAVWKVEGDGLVRVPVKAGVTDGTMTEVLEGNLVPGSFVATDIVRQK